MKPNPPFRFHLCEEGVFRGAYPKERNYSYLQRLRLASILSLTPNEPSKELKHFISTNNIKSIHYKIDKPKENLPLTYPKVVQILQFIIDPSNLPIYVHCLDGTVITGIVIACLRKLQCWSIYSAMNSFSRWLPDGIAEREHIDFIENFKGEVEIPSSIPSWLWPQYNGIQAQGSKKHPTLKLVFPLTPIVNTKNIDQNNQQQNTATIEEQKQSPSSSNMQTNITMTTTTTTIVSTPISVMMIAKDELRRQQQSEIDTSPRSLSSQVFLESVVDVSEEKEKEEIMSYTLQALDLELSNNLKF